MKLYQWQDIFPSLSERPGIMFRTALLMVYQLIDLKKLDH